MCPGLDWRLFFSMWRILCPPLSGRSSPSSSSGCTPVAGQVISGLFEGCCQLVSFVELLFQTLTMTENVDFTRLPHSIGSLSSSFWTPRSGDLIVWFDWVFWWTLLLPLSGISVFPLCTLNKGFFLCLSAAVWSTHLVWFISACLRNNKTWQLDSRTYRSPADIITQSDMATAATIMDWSFRLHLWLESKWGATPRLPRWRKSEACKVRVINWCGCCHIQRDFYISTSARSSSAAKDSGRLKDRVLISSSSQHLKWLLEVVWSLLLRLNVLIHRVRANLKFQEQIISFNIRALAVSDKLRRLPWSSKCQLLIVVWFSSFCRVFRKHFLLINLQTMLVVK